MICKVGETPEIGVVSMLTSPIPENLGKSSIEPPLSKDSLALTSSGEKV
jgi:hypothetical protein